MSEFHCCDLAAESGFWHTKECPYGAVMAERDSLKARLEEQERIAEGLAAALREAYDDVDAFAEQAGVTIRVNRAALRAWEARADG